MALVSISEAARLTKRSRTTIYRYRDEGKISISSDHQGNPAIDTSELLRVFGEIGLNNVVQAAEQVDEHHVTSEYDTVHHGKNTENTLLKEAVNRLEAELDEAKRREAWLQGQMERLTLLLTHTSTPSQTPHTPWWRFW
ncbi:helix-turn-helix domain-containing protein [Acidithiobacillus sp.]|uniref:helix-turn-helix domain-containing protein n=1 Tax=Acidithiobacillus sp. TaxID=1872118 RepID=UPI00261C6740|nr:helix-turn-helix domain-containing protein [Acidithiobacillus sp.]